MHNYTKSRKDYYEKNKEAVKERAKESMKKLAEENPDKLKEYARRAYLKQKEKKRLAEEKLWGVDNLEKGAKYDGVIE